MFTRNSANHIPYQQLELLRMEGRKERFARQIAALVTGFPEEEFRVNPGTLTCVWENGDEKIVARLLYEVTEFPFRGDPVDDTAYFFFKDGEQRLVTTPWTWKDWIFVIRGVSTKPEIVKIPQVIKKIRT